MTRKVSQSIYETAASHAPNEKTLREPPAATEAAAWQKEQRRMKLQNWLFLLTVVAFGVLISVVAVQYYMLSRVPPEQARSIFDIEASDSAGYRILTSGGRRKSAPEELLVVDDVADFNPMLPPAGAEVPLSATWVKQAGYYITRAEKAYQDNNPEEALAMYDHVISIFPSIQGVHHYRGLCYLQLGDAAAAAEAFAMASDQDSPGYGLENNLGVSYLTLKDYQKAEEHFLRAVELKPDYSLALLNLGTLYVRTDRPERAVEYYDRYLKLKPGDLQASQAYAHVLLQQQLWERALPVLTGIVKQAPELAPAYLQLGEALYRTGSTGDAIKSLQKGASLMDPRNALAQLADPRFDGIRNTDEFRALVRTLGSDE